MVSYKICGEDCIHNYRILNYFGQACNAMEHQCLALDQELIAPVIRIVNGRFSEYTVFPEWRLTYSVRGEGHNYRTLHHFGHAYNATARGGSPCSALLRT